MVRVKMGFRGAALLGFGAILLLAVFVPVSARAQIMHDDGFALPWFHSRAENMARQACEDELPECRDSVRRQLVTEKLITNLSPWVLLCLVILGAFAYVRRQEAKREQKRHEAARQHVREAQRGPRKGQGDGEDERRADQGDMDDDMHMGRPGDRR